MHMHARRALLPVHHGHALQCGGSDAIMALAEVVNVPES
jgi:hypothetical protein